MRLRSLAVTAFLFCLSATTAGSGTFLIDFDSALPVGTAFYDSSGAGLLRSSGGNPAAGGYLAVTDATGGHFRSIAFPDFDDGQEVLAFQFACDVRIGNGSRHPADGFSISIARSADQAVGNLSSYASFAGGIPEAGTTTGIAVGFDSWSGNTLPDGPDVEGLIVRVNNTTVLRHDMPVRNGDVTDPTSLQTGPFDGAAEGGALDVGTGSPDGLGWARFEISMSLDQRLTVRYKDTTILDNLDLEPYGLTPSALQIVMAGRTGGGVGNNHVDNLLFITTVPEPESLAVLSGVVLATLPFLLRLVRGRPEAVR
ncbi:MAG: hypothetical protein KF833_01310 [Verrucomicrobiae bacterium]|nr:hypothetical protein [Verrucomicrobiae bacterium]